MTMPDPMTLLEAFGLATAGTGIVLTVFTLVLGVRHVWRAK